MSRILLLICFCVLLVRAACAIEPVSPTSPEALRREIDSIEALVKQARTDSAKVNLLCLLASRIKDTDNNLSLQYAEQAVQAAATSGRLWSKAQAARMKARILNTIGNYTQSVQWSLQALRYCEQLGDSNGMVTLYNNIGIIYNNLSRYDVAERYLLRALHLEERINIHNDTTDNLMLSQIYGNLGITMMEKTGSLDRGIGYFKKVLELEAHGSNYRVKAITLMNIAELYYRKKQYSDARRHILLAFRLAQQQGMGEYYFMACYKDLGKVALEENRFAEAEKYLLKAKDIAEKIDDHRVLMSNYELLGRLYLNMKNAERSVHYYNRYHAIKDSVNNEQVAAQLKELTQGYEVEKRDQEIRLLNQNNLLDKRVRNSVVIALVLAVSILVIVGWNARQKQKTNSFLRRQKDQIERQKEQIEEQNVILDTYNRELQKENIYARYEVLRSKVNPHFLFNSLSSLAALIPEEPDRALEFALRFSQLYRTIIDQSEQNLITLAKEKELVKNYVFLQQIRFLNNLHVEFSDLSHSRKQFVPPFALQIVVENAIRHNIISNEQPLTISITIKDTEIEVTNPVQARKNNSPGAGFGQHNLVERYRMLGRRLPEFAVRGSMYVATVPVLATDKEPAIKEQETSIA